MPVTVQCDDFELTVGEAEQLWQETRQRQEFPDEQVTVRCVDEEEMQRLNEEYRGKRGPTNVLTFSYAAGPDQPGELGDSGEHDVALCVAVATREAEQREVPRRDYLALLLTHALLHVVGMDHERSAVEATAMHEAELAIMRAAGFTALQL